MNKKIIKKNSAIKILSQLGNEFAVVNNPDYIFSPLELYPLAKKQKSPVKTISAFVMDMDGTTTTTETLCLYSLDRTIALMSGKKNDCPRILDKKLDYPHIIGNSTTKHVEFLIDKYQSGFKREKIISAFLFAAMWTIKFGKDSTRKKEVEQNLKNYNCYEITSDKYFARDSSTIGSKCFSVSLEKALLKKYSRKFSSLTKNDLVKIGVDIYYQKYHQLLYFVVKNNRKELNVVLDENHERIIEPMPGVEVFLPLIKGMIHKDHDVYFNYLMDAYKRKSGKIFPKTKISSAKNNFIKLCNHFEKHPAKVAVVTSSIYYEANIVLKELFRVISLQLRKMLPDKADKVLLSFANHEKYYDAIITASDSSEIRLKPHRDLYSIALSALNVSKKDFGNVIGLEDSESGTIAIRAAGIGFSIAVPFNETSGHRFDAASHVLHGGLAELIFSKNCFIKN